MSESYVEVREDGSVRLAGTLAYPEATVADVLTVQADGSIAAAAGGGSPSIEMFGPYTVTYQSADLTGNGFPLHTFPAGTVLWEAFVYPVTQFDPDNGMGLQDDTNTFSWVAVGSTAKDDEGPFGFGQSQVGTPARLLTQTVVSAWASPAGGPFTAGEVNIYIIASIP